MPVWEGFSPDMASPHGLSRLKPLPQQEIPAPYVST